MKHFWLPSLVLFGAILPGERPGPEAWNLSDREPVHLPTSLNVSITVFSDPHFYDPALGLEGEAFEQYLKNDRKLLRESTELMQEAITTTMASGTDLVLIPGDLTKDGTLRSHEGMIAFLEQLEALGQQVLVIPGNHDISNGEAVAYQGDSTLRMENVGPDLFKKIYRPYGYGEALFRDPHSLSYIAEPMKGLWILGLDPCLYAFNDSLGHPHTGGAFKKETLNWLENVLVSEEARGKLKMAMMHHGILEHYHGQKRYFGEYVVEDYRKVSRMLAGYDVKVVFTGHYHANDITVKRWQDGSFLFDVETGSLVTYPCPLRRVNIRGDTMVISTEHIRSIPSVEGNFMEYARSYVHEGVAGIAEKTMIEMNLRPEDAHRLSFQIGDAFSSHYLGDEVPADPLIDLEGVDRKGRLIIRFRKKLIKGLYNDLPPADNQLTIHLPSGHCR